MTTETTLDVMISAINLRPSRRMRTVITDDYGDAFRLVSTVHTADGWETLSVPLLDGHEHWQMSRECGRWDSADDAYRAHAMIVELAQIGGVL